MPFKLFSFTYTPCTNSHPSTLSQTILWNVWGRQWENLHYIRGLLKSRERVTCPRWSWTTTHGANCSVECGTGGETLWPAHLAFLPIMCWKGPSYIMKSYIMDNGTGTVSSTGMFNLWCSAFSGPSADPALVCCDCHLKLSQTWWFKVTEIYSLTVWEARNLKSKCQQGLFCLEAQLHPYLCPSFWWLPAITGILWLVKASFQQSASVFTSLYPLCMPLLSVSFMGHLLGWGLAWIIQDIISRPLI